MRRGTAWIITAYTVLLLYWMFIGFGRMNLDTTSYHYNLIPFHTIKMYFKHADHFDLRTWAINVIGNIAVFVPFGLAVPVLWKQTWLRFVLQFMGVLIVLESLQLVSKRGSLDIDDLLLNTIGAAIGFGLYRMIVKRVTYKL
ncbi:glycopeptide antibiotics resistance protein [Paenibacillus phyllosphaerae]|uniref:Glycopeptide antibiotics resistance protein n=1 Tax=Paenibacillus phyllosphaerae TaxID=274593 RepID=A0A7W5AWA5_9BACL|nr:VanZ family protein [Paenibacillus phyllosphaerae]MBB3109999.1 glycopeptide antibiotics resistance protein [Paenibacillus phyllosphaerae]